MFVNIEDARFKGQMNLSHHTYVHNSIGLFGHHVFICYLCMQRYIPNKIEWREYIDKVVHRTNFC
jgi:hypothetical protein